MAPAAPRPGVLKNDRRLTSRGVVSSMLRTAGFIAPSLSVGRCSLCPMRKILLVAFGLFGIVVAGAALRAAPDDWILYVGTYTKAPSKGIYAYRFQGATGALTPIGADGLAGETENPSFLAVHPNQRFLYAVNEVSRYEGRDAGSVSAFSIDRATGTLTLLNRVSSRGGGPCHLSLDRSGKWLFVANYGGGSVAAFPVRGDGTLGEASAFFQHAGASVNKARQNGPPAHDAGVSPDNRFVLAPDLGLDRGFAYRLGPATGGLRPLPRRRESELRHGRRLSDRSADRRSHTDRNSRSGRVSRLRCLLHTLKGLMNRRLSFVAGLRACIGSSARQVRRRGNRDGGTETEEQRRRGGGDGGNGTSLNTEARSNGG